MPSPNTCMNSCYTDPWNPNCSCDLEPCDMYIFVNNIWFTKDNDMYWDDPGYINFSISWLRSSRPDSYVLPVGSYGRTNCGSSPSPTDVYQGTLGDFRIVLDTCNGLWGQEVQIGTDGETIQFGENPEHLNGLIVTRVRSPWLNPGGYIYDYDNIGPDSLNPNGIFGGVNYELTQRNKCASVVIGGRTTIGQGDVPVGAFAGEVLAEVRAKFHGGETGGFDTKFQPKTSDAPGQCEQGSPYIIDTIPDQTFDDDDVTCYGSSEYGEMYPNKCGYWDGTFGMGGMCDNELGCSGDDYSYFDGMTNIWGKVQAQGSQTDWDGIGHTYGGTGSGQCGVGSELGDGNWTCDICWPGFVQPRLHCDPSGYCKRGLGDDGDYQAWRCGGLTEPNSPEYCLATHCGGSLSNCPVNIISQASDANMNTPSFRDKYYNRVRYNDCIQSNYDCISGDKERNCANPHTGGSDGWCHHYNHPFGSTSSESWPVSGVGYPNDTFTFNVTNDPECLPNDISADNVDSVCATYFHTFSTDMSSQQIGNWAWIQTDWNTRENYKQGNYNCDGGQCELLNFELVAENLFGCTDQSACNYCPNCVEHIQADCDYGSYYCPRLGGASDGGCKPCEEKLTQMGILEFFIEIEGSNSYGTTPGVDCTTLSDLCEPMLACQQPDSQLFSNACVDIDPYCADDTYDDCGVCCGSNTGNQSCDPDFSKDCNGDCLGGGFLDDCGDCVTDGIPNQAYLDSCIGGRIWTTAEQELNGLVCGQSGLDSNCCCGTTQSGASDNYTGCDRNRPQFFYWDADGDGAPCYGAVDFILSCQGPPVTERDGQYVEGPAPAFVNQNDWDNIICAGGNPCDWADSGWDELCECAADFYDACGVCNGDGTLCSDCHGDTNGSATIDSCGNCIKCCTPEEEAKCQDFEFYSERPVCCGKLTCTNPIFNSSSCMHTGYDPANLTGNGEYPEENIAGGVGAPGGECKGEGWLFDDDHDWSNKWCECYTWAATSCGEQAGSNGDNICSSNGGEEITGWDYKAWDNRIYDSQWWEDNTNCTASSSSNRCGQGDRLVHTTRQIYDTNNNIVGSYEFNYTSQGPGEISTNNYWPSSEIGDERFGGYCGEHDGAGSFVRDNGTYYGTGSAGKIQSFGNNKFSPTDYEPSIKDDWINIARSGPLSGCEHSLTGDCSSDFSMERSCKGRVGRCGVCNGGQSALETPPTGTWIDMCELCGGDGSTCGGSAETCYGNCWDSSTTTYSQDGGSYLAGADCDCSTMCVWFRDCCSNRWEHCADENAIGQIGVGSPYGTSQCIAHSWQEVVCADCDLASMSYDLENNQQTYRKISGGGLVYDSSLNPGECKDGGWSAGWYKGYLQSEYPVDIWCEMVAAAGYVWGNDTNGAHGNFYDPNLTVSGDGQWCGDLFSNDDNCMKQKAPWFYCAVETCCQNVWNWSQANGANYYCFYYGGVSSYGQGLDADWEHLWNYSAPASQGSQWYRGWGDYFPPSPYAGHSWGPYIPQELVNEGLISGTSHCPVR